MLVLTIFKKVIPSLTLLANSALFDNHRFFLNIMSISLVFISMPKFIDFALRIF